MQTVSNDLLKETVSRLNQAIDRHVMGSVTTLEAAFPSGIQAKGDIRTDFEKIRTRLWTASSLYLYPNNYVYYGNKAGQAIGLYRDSINTAELRVKFEPEDHRIFYNIDGIHGEPQFSSIEEENFDPRVRPWFQAAWNNLDDIWTSVYIDFRTHNLVATRARRVQGAHGALEGVVATDMSLKSLNDFIGNLNVSDNGVAFIVEPNGLLIASSHSSNIKQDENGFNTRVLAAESENPLLAETYRKIKPLISNDVEYIEPETFSFIDENNRNIYVGYNEFKDDAGLKWINVVAIPSEDFMGGIKDSIAQTLILGVLATAFATAIGFMIVQWVTKDLKILSNAVNRVGSNYLNKPINIKRIDEIGDLAKNFSAMLKRLHTNFLTGLPNRYSFEQYIKATVDKDVAANTVTPFAVLFFDLNDFKRINDEYGHDMGDQVLKEFALKLQSSIPEEDLAARLGGDEFVMVLNNVQNQNDVEPTLMRIRKALSEPLHLSESLVLTLKASVGVAYYPENGNNVEQLLAVADEKMYINKAEIKKNQNLS